MGAAALERAAFAARLVGLMLELNAVIPTESEHAVRQVPLRMQGGPARETAGGTVSMITASPMTGEWETAAETLSQRYRLRP